MIPMTDHVVLRARMSEEFRGIKRRLALYTRLYVLDRWRDMENGEWFQNFLLPPGHQLMSEQCPEWSPATCPSLASVPDT